MRDTGVKELSQALHGVMLDWVVSGSIAAVEVVKAIRAVRRLGARVRVTMTREAQRFITPTACAWASGREVSTDWSPLADHIGDGDALVIAPCSASLLGKIAASICDAPALSLAASYLGQGKPVIAHPCMHQSLAANPFLHDIYARLEARLSLIAPLKEEDKDKFLPPPQLAEEIAHRINGNGKCGTVLIVSGRTVAVLDAVRGITNFSSGEMGMLIATELYRQGFATHIVSGAGEYRPVACSSLVEVSTPAEMGEQAQRLLQAQVDAALVMVAAVLDFVPATKVDGKISSQQQELNVRLVPVPKLIQTLHPRSRVKVVFKLPATFNPEQNVRETLGAYFDPQKKTQASLLVVNPGDMMVSGARKRQGVSEARKRQGVSEASEAYRAYLFSPDFSYTYVRSKQAVARFIGQHIAAGLGGKK